MPALDLVAVEHGLTIENLPEVRVIAMALLTGRPVRVVDPHNYLADMVAAYPERFIPEPDLDLALSTARPRGVRGLPGTPLAGRLAAAAAPKSGGRHGLP